MVDAWNCEGKTVDLQTLRNFTETIFKGVLTGWYQFPKFAAIKISVATRVGVAFFLHMIERLLFRLAFHIEYYIVS